MTTAGLRAAVLAWLPPIVLVCGLLVCAPAAADTPPALGTAVVATVGPGYTLTSEGPLNASELASGLPDPAATKAVLRGLKNLPTFQRVWKEVGGRNQVQDLLVRFPSGATAQMFLQALQGSLASGEILSSGALSPLPGARRTTYFASTTLGGVGQAISMPAGLYVDLLSFFSAASGTTPPISPAATVRVAQAQQAAMVAAGGGTSGARAPTAPTKKSNSRDSLGWAILVVAVLVVAVATPALLRRRRQRRGLGTVS